MFEFVSEHQFWAAVAIYWIFSAAVSSIIKASPWRARASRPDPRTVGSSGYLWLYRFLHSIAGNVTTAFAGKIPGLKTFLLVVMIPGLLAVSSCGARYTVHPGALDKTDSAAYDVLLIAQSTIDQARILYQAGQLPGAAAEALNKLIEAYNIARESWLIYRGAPSAIYLDQVTRNVSDLARAGRAFETEAK